MTNLVFPSASFVLAACASFVGETFGTMFGGGSFFIQPALLAIGVPSRMAVANDVAAAAFSCSFFVLFSLQKQEIDCKIAGWMVPFMATGAVVGGLILSRIPSIAEMWIILVICGAGLARTLIHINMPNLFYGKKPIKHWRRIAIPAALALGTYDGISGAGSGVLIMTTLVLLFNGDLKTTIVMANLLGAVSEGIAGLTFWRLGLLDGELLLAMIPAYCLAGIAGAKIVHAVPDKFLRIAFALTIAALLVFVISKKS